MNRAKRPAIIDGTVAKIPIYRKGEIIYALVDADDLELVDGIYWSTDNRGYARAAHSLYMHRLILRPSSHEQTDHINGNRLDNRRSNLRVATNQQNQMARHAVVATSGYKGVHKHGKKWRAQIKFNRKLIRLGSYPTPEKAAKAYDQAARALFEDRAVLNEYNSNTRTQVARPCCTGSGPETART